MGYWPTLLIGILGGLIVAFFVYIIRSAFLGRFENFLRLTPAKLRKSLSWEYRNPKKAEKSIAKDIEATTTMSIFCLKGSTFCNQHSSSEKTSYKVLHNKNNAIKQRYLISHPDNPYIRKRAPEIGTSADDLKNGIEISIRHLEDESVSLPKNVSFRKHMEVVRQRLYIFDNNLYLSFQPVNVAGKDCSVQKYPRGSNGYTALEAYFNELWDKYEGGS